MPVVFQRAFQIIHCLNRPAKHLPIAKRLIAVGFGSTKPVASNYTPMDKAQNRRMEFIPTPLKGTAIGGCH